MKNHAPSPLAQQVAGIHACVRAEADHLAAQAGLVAALHALIFNCLARILTRFADLVALWQAGQLPLPTPRAAREHPLATRAVTPRHPTCAYPHTRTPFIKTPPIGDSPAMAPPGRSPRRRAPPGTRGSPVTPRPNYVPFSKFSGPAQETTHAHIITIS